MIVSQVRYHCCRPASAHTDSMPGRLDHIVADAHDLSGLARFRAQAPGWKVPVRACGRDRRRDHQNAAAGLCLMPVTDPKTVKNRLHLDLTSSAQGPGPSGPTPGKPVLRDTPEGNAQPGKARAR